MKTVVTDLDGTLLNNRKLTQNTINICKEFQKNNRLVLATGRNLSSCKQFYEQLDLEQNKGALILLNGASFYDFNDHEYIQPDYLKPLSVRLIILISYLLSFNITLVCENKTIKIDGLYYRLYYLLLLLFRKQTLPKQGKYNKNDKIEKIELYPPIKKVYKFTISILRFILFNYEIVEVSKHWIEIIPKNTNKLNMLKYLVQKYNISQDDLYVFGDGENDIDMLKYAKNSYTPSDALISNVHIGNHICESSTKDGVAEIIKLL